MNKSVMSVTADTAFVIGDGKSCRLTLAKKVVLFLGHCQVEYIICAKENSKENA